MKALNNYADNKVCFTFPSGVLVSVIWGYGTYSESRDAPEGRVESDDCEIMICNACDNLRQKIQMYYPEMEFEPHVAGNVSLFELIDVLNIIKEDEIKSRNIKEKGV